MYSMKWPESAPMRGGLEAVIGAVSDVAERSFFAMVESCDGDRFAELTAAHRDWLSASVSFDEPGCAGMVTCHLPMLLAERLFDAFTGRDPDEPPADVAEVHDLVGEFANMICGSWLTRAANDRTFTLGRPEVRPSAEPVAGGLSLVVDEQPCVVAVAFTRVPEAVTSR